MADVDPGTRVQAEAILIEGLSDGKEVVQWRHEGLREMLGFRAATAACVASRRGPPKVLLVLPAVLECRKGKAKRSRTEMQRSVAWRWARALRRRHRHRSKGAG